MLFNVFLPQKPVYTCINQNHKNQKPSIKHNTKKLFFPKTTPSNNSKKHYQYHKHQSFVHIVNFAQIKLTSVSMLTSNQIELKKNKRQRDSGLEPISSHNRSNSKRNYNSGDRIQPMIKQHSQNTRTFIFSSLLSIQIVKNLNYTILQSISLVQSRTIKQKIYFPAVQSSQL